jgi:hypothetical protein
MKTLQPLPEACDHVLFVTIARTSLIYPSPGRHVLNGFTTRVKLACGWNCLTQLRSFSHAPPLRITPTMSKASNARRAEKRNEQRLKRERTLEEHL